MNLAASILAAGPSFDAYTLVIGASLVVMISYFFNQVAKKTNIPSVLLLIGLGIGIQYLLASFGLKDIQSNSLIKLGLEILGTVGLIFIVLEAALDLELNKEKWPTIWKSFLTALLGLVLTVGVITAFFFYFIMDDLFQAMIYAIPLSIMSSAIIIPSVGGLAHEDEEFMVYESTFSDILGIMFFYLALGNDEVTSAGTVVWNVSFNILVTIVLSFILCYGLVFLFQKIRTQVKLFLMVAVLVFLYAVGKKFHLSSLILILFFGLMLNNYKLFFVGRLRKTIDPGVLLRVLQDFHILTLESAFVVRTFFFVVFGFTITVASIFNLKVVFYSMLLVVGMYLVRLLMLAIFKPKNISPLLYIAPRGLITILLFFAIPAKYQSLAFDSGILLFVILTSSIVMTVSLIQNGLQIKPADDDVYVQSGKLPTAESEGLVDPSTENGTAETNN